MKHQGPKNWSRDPAPLGTVRIRRSKSLDGARFIKVTHLGPKSRRWKPLARHWWEKNKGPVPRGMRVAHLNGRTLDDRPENYGLMTGGQIAVLYRRVRPDVWKKMVERRAAATAEVNRLRGFVKRATSWLATHWYVVDPARRIVFNHPRGARHQALALCGLSGYSVNGRLAPRILRESKLGFIIVRGDALAAPEFSGFARTEELPTIGALLAEPRRRHTMAEALAGLAAAITHSQTEVA